MSKFDYTKIDNDIERFYNDGGPVPAHDAGPDGSRRDHLRPIKFTNEWPKEGETVRPVSNFREFGPPRALPDLPAAERVSPFEDAKDQLALKAGVGIKYDAGKAPVRQGVLEYFPRALIEIALVSAFGAKKYSWGNWKKGMPDGINRLGNASARHILGALLDKDGLDPETGLLHAAQEAWNCLARLELLLEERDSGKNTS